MTYPRPLVLCSAAFGLALVFVPSIGHAQIVRTFDLAPGGRLVLDADRGSVDVRPGSGRGVRVEVLYDDRTAEGILDDFAVTFTAQGSGQLTVLSRYRHGTWRRVFGWRTRPRFIVDVPAAFHLDLRTVGGAISVGALRGDVQARTSGGPIELDAIDGMVTARTSGGGIRLAAATQADLETSGGGISVGRVRNGLRVETSGGSIRVAGAGRTDARTAGGSIRLEGIAGPINAHTSGGSITASLAGQPVGDSRLETSGGDVTLDVPATIAADLDARTSGGGVRMDVPVTVQGTTSRNEIRGRVNGGGPMLVLRTSGGSVRVRAR